MLQNSSTHKNQLVEVQIQTREGGMKALSGPRQEYLQQSRELEKASSTKALLLC